MSEEDTGWIKLHSIADEERWNAMRESFRQSPYYKPEMEQQEEKPLPVAVYMGVYGGKHIVGFTESKIYPVGTALYLHPPKTKTTVYLTRDEIDRLWDKFYADTNVVNFARAIEHEVLRRNK